MPIYEYRCPEGHTFERFQSMTAPAPEKCDVCGGAPLEIVLFPVAIHYKGSGFYSTDYGKGKKKDESAKPSESKSDSKPADSKSSDSKPASSSTSSD
jgi:putative FmdB family regulatory protein